MKLKCWFTHRCSKSLVRAIKFLKTAMAKIVIVMCIVLLILSTCTKFRGHARITHHQ